MDTIEQEDAVTLLNQRLKEENKTKNEIYEIIIFYFSKILDLVFPCYITANTFRIDLLPQKEQVNTLLAQMRKEIYNAISKHSEKVIKQNQSFFDSDIDLDIDAVFSEGEDNIHDKCYMYSKRLTKEFESWIALALFYKWDKSTLLSKIKENIKNPYSNKDFNTAIRKGSFVATRLKYGGVSYGAGQYNSAFNSLMRLSVIALGVISKSAGLKIFSSQRIKGISVYRGSTYPCPLCDDHVGTFPLSEEYMPPFHANCKCYAVPVEL